MQQASRGAGARRAPKSNATWERNRSRADSRMQNFKRGEAIKHLWISPKVNSWARRFPFIASAEALSESEGMRLTARIQRHQCHRVLCRYNESFFKWDSRLLEASHRNTHVRSAGHGRLLACTSRDGIEDWRGPAEFSGSAAGLAASRGSEDIRSKAGARGG